MDVFQALADPVRRDLLNCLGAGPRRVVDLAGDQRISRPAVSRHLRCLSEAGLVHGEDRGRERHYRLDTTPLAAVQELIDALQSHPTPAPITPANLDALDTEVRRVGRERRTASSNSSPTATTGQRQKDIA